MMKVVRGVAVGSMVLASLTVFSACFLDWDDLPPLDTARDALSDAPVVAPIEDAAPAGETSTTGSEAGVGCHSTADCTSGERCYFASGSPCTGLGKCVAATSACAMNGALGATSTNGFICGCDNLGDACAPTGATAECSGLPGTAVACGYVSCPSSTTFCDTSQDGQRFECKPWASVSCSSAEHSCACAEKVCAGGTCVENAGAIVVTCP